MFEKKLNKKDLEEVRKRSEMINQHLLTVEALKFQIQVYIKGLLPKYKCDLNRNYTIDFKNGRIIEIKEKIKENVQEQTSKL